MKHLRAILAAAALCIATTGFAATLPDADTPSDVKAEALNHGRTYYIEIVGANNQATGAFTVTINIGRNLAARLGLSQAQLQRLAATKKFTSMSDAMNYLSDYGWHLDTSYTTTARGNSMVYWVISRTAVDPMELLDGIID